MAFLGSDLMVRARKIELSSIVGKLPDLERFNPAEHPAFGPDDLFLCALGFEPRCLTLPRMLAECGYRSKRVLFFEYDTNVDENAVNRQELTKYLNAISADVQPLSLGDPDYPNELRHILKSCSGEASGEVPRVTFDLSVAANRIVVTTMGTLFEAQAYLNLLYSEAATYYPTEIEYTADPSAWRTESQLGLERGVGAVRPSREFPGQHLDQLPDAVILFPTFKAERSQAVIDFVDPSLVGTQGEQIVWLVGVPPLPQNQWRIGALREINDLTKNHIQHEISTLDYKETLSRLESIYKDLWDKYKLTLSPIGSKMQALGSSLFSYMHPDTRIVFAIPKEYNAAQYSDGWRETWRIEFGRLSDLRELLGSVGKLVID